MSYASRQFAQNWINHYSRKDTNHHIKGSDTAANRRTLVIVPFSAVIDDRLGAGRLDTFTTTVDTEMDLNTAANWDTVTPTDYTVAATRAGKDFYIYACVQAGNVPKIMISAASTYPSGYTANNSRKIGGFHALCDTIAGVAGSHPAYGFLIGDIVPTSVWDLLDCPESSPEGMAKVPGVGWVDMYLPNGTGTTCTSVFGATIKANVIFPTFQYYAFAANKRLLKDWEFTKAAAGSNEATSIAGGAVPATVAAHLDTAGRSMISNYFIWDMAGALRQWLDETGYFWALDGSVASGPHYAYVYHAASPGGVQVYLKFDAGGNNPYLCADLAGDADIFVTFTGTYSSPTIRIKYDADPSTGGIPIYVDHDATQPYRLLFVSPTGEIAFVRFKNRKGADMVLAIAHDANAASKGVSLYYDDGADARFEFVAPNAANCLIYNVLSTISSVQFDNWQSKGVQFTQGVNGLTKVLAGGAAGATTQCGSNARDYLNGPTFQYANISCRYMSPAKAFR